VKPRQFTGAIVSAAILCGAAIWLHLHWDDIPARFPTHWNLAGVPNGWGTRTFRAIYWPIIMGLGNAVLLCVIGSALGDARPGTLRLATQQFLNRIAILLSLLFAAIALSRLHAGLFSPALAAPIMLVVTGLLLVPVMRANSNPDSDDEPATPAEAWKFGGQLYYNPDDPALMVQKRIGIGYTVNFARPLAWVLLGSFLVLPLILLLTK
jgi:uncharacterized membrane protein